MTTIYLRGGAKTNTSVKVLTEHLTKLGHSIVRNKNEEFDAIVGWGVSRQEVEGPMLNAGVNQFNKFEAIKEFHRKRIPAPTVFRAREVGENKDNPFPWLARRFNHHGGKDIKVVNGLGEARRMVIQYLPDFFSVYIPTRTEYRVWVFRDEAFAVYEKVWKGEGEYQGVQRNHAFGFRFDKRDDLLENEALCHWGVEAVKALGMDMGAVDVIEAKDGELYVLEVNSMPSIESVKKVSGIRLAKRISDWAETA
jgi:glutathione synthase/RimK-type ligase-like ATP-grasp enzyme